MPTIYRWSAFRSGATMTVVGLDSDGAEIKVTGVTELTAGEGHVSAGNGREVVARLAVA